MQELTVANEATLAEILTPYKARAREIRERVESVVIDSPEQEEKANDSLGIIKRAKSKLEDERKTLVKPLNDHVKWINGAFKEVTDDLTAADKLLRERLGAYLLEKRQREEAERREAQKRAEEAALEAAAKAEASGNAEQANETLDLAARSEAKKAGGPVRTQHATTSATEVWKVCVRDWQAIPSRFLSVPQESRELRTLPRTTLPLLELDCAQVKRALDAGEEIPGLYAEKALSLAVR